MASSKEMQQTSRPLTHRPSISSTSVPGGLTLSRQTHSRNNSHSLLGAALNGSHRITRRKSMTNTGANVAAVAAAAAALQESGDMAMPLPIAVNGRRNTMSKSGLSRSAIVGSLPSPPASLPTHRFAAESGTVGIQESAIDDELNDMSGDDGASAFRKARVRRASDGQPLTKEGGRKSNRPELRCEKWEHTPEWSYTSKLLISKHQQVQLLEAASVLVAMNNASNNHTPTTTAAAATAVTTTPPDSARDFSSERDSASPAASGYSDQQDRGSADTTPPPQLDATHPANSSYRSFGKRSSSGNGLSRSYQTAPYASSAAGSIPSVSGFGHFRQLSHDQRPTSSGRNATGQDDRELAAAVELLSCSFGSNSGSRTVHLPADAPPVPPLPAQYLDQGILSGTSFINSYPSRAPESFTRGERRQVETKMEESGESVMGDDDEDMRSRARSDEDDDGVFGRMEE
ncbi:4866af30-fb10-4049-b223-b3c8f1d1d7c2 [Thermothielavioides terrestris]|uniref:4866af30-fb10-4049-b223-b3c8f1d1d7c2 n=1 Tax=Thermothielavioides terrestris TaxID=2587410 RepID=A0A446BIL2_9PEZI|nr:4866af30-fb10-4049-b223-b3c8f1d1d7c2 [Thermothielavioides terrestris]